MAEIRPVRAIYLNSENGWNSKRAHYVSGIRFRASFFYDNFFACLEGWLLGPYGFPVAAGGAARAGGDADRYKPPLGFSGYRADLGRRSRTERLAQIGFYFINNKLESVVTS